MGFILNFLLLTVVSVTSSSATSLKRLEFLEMVQWHGYTGEYHHVTTDDGYILRIDRITSSPLVLSNNNNKPVVFLQHGLFSLSDHFVLWDRNSSLAFALADAGYDVWLGNFRGSTNSRNHTSLSPTSREFWNFDRNDWGVRDVAAMIDYVLSETGKRQLSYVGHSCGCSAGLSLLSEKPEYNEKINIFVNLAPVAYWIPVDSVLWMPGMNIGIEGLQMLSLAPDYAVEVFPAGGSVTMFCNVFMFNELCTMIFNTFVGHPTVPFNEEEAEYLTQYIPAGTSLKILNHLKQNINSNKFAQYDYEDKYKNRQVYGQDEAPQYDLSKVTAPTAILRSDGDFFATKKNIQQLVASLPNVVWNTVVEDPKFTHIDYFFHGDARTMYIDQVLQLIEQYKS